MIQNVAPLVDLTALDRRQFAGILSHRSMQRLAAIQNIQPWLGEIEPAVHQVVQQLSHHGAFSVAPCRIPKIVFRPSWLMPSAATICWPANGVASMSSAHNRTLPGRRSIISFSFSRLASKSE